jgi:hypothetical protein
MRPMPSVSTAAARQIAPTYARFIRPLGFVAVGDATERKNARGMRIAAAGASRHVFRQRAEERQASVRHGAIRVT